MAAGSQSAIPKPKSAIRRMIRYIYRKKSLILAAWLFDVICGGGWRLVRVITPSRGRRPAELPPSPRVAFIRLDGVGDVVDSLQAARAVKARFPDGALCLIVQKRVAALISTQPFVDQVLAVDFELYSPATGLFRSIRNIFRLRRLLAANRFDIAVEPRGDPRIILAMWASGIPVRIGVRSAGAAFLLTASCDYTRSIPEAAHNLLVASLLGVKEPEEPFRLEAGPEVWESLLGDYPMLRRPFFVVHSSGTMQTRIWPVERFAEALDAIAERYGLLPVIDGGSDCLPDAEKMTRLCRAQILNLAGKTDLVQLCALTSHARLFLGNNSGPAHIAAYSGCPTVIVFGGANDPAVWKPPGEHVAAVANMLDCSPCDLRFCPDPKCMTGISVADVLEAVDKLLSHYPKS